MRELSDKIKGGIALLPDKPGVYLMKDVDDRIIYIGKAKNLKKRVSQYFLRPQSGKVQAMVSHVDHFDFIIVNSDKESFILEMNLIQTHYPRYNIMLMDDSHYPYIAIKRDDAYLKISRNTDDKRYFYCGPFPASGAASKTIDLLNSLYPTRKCRKIPKKECLYYHLGQCLGPCINKIDESEYNKLYADIKSFLDGSIDEAAKKIKEKMNLASSELRFEDASYYKGLLEAIKQTVEKQSVEINDRTDRDVFAYVKREGYISLAILTYRKGILLGKNVKVVEEWDDDDLQVSELIEEYYQNHELPKEISTTIKGFEEEFLSIYPSAKIICPKDGRLFEQISLAALNARQGLDTHFMSARLEDDKLKLLEELGGILGMKAPLYIELFDNSHLQGSDAIGAMVAYVNGAPCKKMYRKYHLEDENAGDDYHSMVEVIGRRYSRLKEENKPFPDLILVDGGLIQVHAALEGLDKAKAKINVFGLYKNDRHQTEGLIDGDGVIYPIDNKSPLFFLLMRMQDEVHRYAITFHRQLRSKRMKRSILDDVQGLGEKRKEKLKKHYPTLESLKEATLEELGQILPLDVAKELKDKIS